MAGISRYAWLRAIRTGKLRPAPDPARLRAYPMYLATEVEKVFGIEKGRIVES
jgi:hypothetical protein